MGRGSPPASSWSCFMTSCRRRTLLDSRRDDCHDHHSSPHQLKTKNKSINYCRFHFFFKFSALHVLALHCVAVNWFPYPRPRTTSTFMLNIWPRLLLLSFILSALLGAYFTSATSTKPMMPAPATSKYTSPTSTAPSSPLVPFYFLEDPLFDGEEAVRL